MSDGILNIDSIQITRVFIDATDNTQASRLAAIVPEAGKLLLIVNGTSIEEMETTITLNGVSVDNKPYIVTGDGITNLNIIADDVNRNPYYVSAKLTKDITSLPSNSNPSLVGSTASGSAITLARADHSHAITQSTIESVVTSDGTISTPHVRRIFSGTSDTPAGTFKQGDIYIKLEG